MNNVYCQTRHESRFERDIDDYPEIAHYDDDDEDLDDDDMTDEQLHRKYSGLDEGFGSWDEVNAMFY